MEAYIKRIAEINELINAVVENDFENARIAARQVDKLFEHLQEGSDEYNKVFHKYFIYHFSSKNTHHFWFDWLNLAFG